MPSARQQALLLLGARIGVRIARRRVARARSLRWAVRVPLVTLTVGTMVVAIAAMMAPAPRHESRRRPARLR